MRALHASTISRLQLFSSIPALLAQGWTVRPTAEVPVMGKGGASGAGYLGMGRNTVLAMWYLRTRRASTPQFILFYSKNPNSHSRPGV